MLENLWGVKSCKYFLCSIILHTLKQYDFQSLFLAATCDHYHRNRTQGLIGTDIMRPGNSIGTSLRNMCDPTQIGIMNCTYTV